MCLVALRSTPRTNYPARRKAVQKFAAQLEAHDNEIPWLELASVHTLKFSSSFSAQNEEVD
jgi:hypothetical protein